MLEGVEAGCFVFRDFESDTGDPARAKRFLNSPLTGSRLLLAIRLVLMRVCGMSAASASAWALHSARHFLMEVAGHRGVVALRKVEIGRWSGSTAQDADLAPAVRLSRSHQLRMGIMPDSYAPSAKEARVCEILGEQMAAVDALYRESRPPRPSLALFAGFECFRRWPARPDDV